MDAPILRFGLIALSLFAFTGATFQTRNFEVTAPDSRTAEQVGRAAEEYRRELATFWLGQPLPNWSRPCKLKVKPGAIGAGGQTTFQFVKGEVLNWNMYVQGSMERILDSVLPHEINHTIFACHFRRPLPRWADEGAATLFEHRSEQMKQLDLLNQVIKSDREFIALPQLLNMKEYPKGMRPMLILYAEGYALVDFLVQQGGRHKYLKFLADGERLGWERAIQEHYDHDGVSALQENWQGWVVAGMPKLTVPEDQMLAATQSADDSQQSSILDQFDLEPTMRGQSPETASDNRLAAREPIGSTSDFASQTVPSAEPSPQTAPTSDGPVWVSSTREDSAFRPDSEPEPTDPGTSSQPAGFDTDSGRRASFQAPAPRAPAATSQTRAQSEQTTDDQQFRPPVAARRDSRFESTALRRETSQSSSSRTNPQQLPRGRNVETGDTPQWAGFPGQKEFF